MANNDSTTVTNLEATPAVVGNSHQLYGKTRVLVETYEVTGSNADTFTYYPVPLDARIDDVMVANDAKTSGTDFDIGFYLITDNDLGAVIDADIMADGISMASARDLWTSVMFTGTGAVDQANCGKKLWEVLGYASITAAREAAGRNEVYLVLTANTIGSGTATVSIKTVITVE